jgi:transposase
MSMKPEADYVVPEATARVARAAFPKSCLCMRIYDRFGAIFRDADFAHLFSPQGQVAASPARLALVTVLQFVEGLTDREAADAVRARIDWKYLLCLPLADPGFDHSVLTEFRLRLIEGQAERLLMDRLLEVLREHELVKARGRQRTDSTHVLAAVRQLNRLERVLETLRAALNAMAEVAPAWVREVAEAEGVGRYGEPAKSWRLPKAEAARAGLLEQVGRDGDRLLSAALSAEAPAAVRALAQLETLRVAWVQNFYHRRGQVRPRQQKDLPPPSVHVDSPYDTDARVATKRGTRWVGYKVHVTESCDDDGPHLITNVETARATEHDSAAVGRIHGQLERAGLLPGRHLVDGGYVGAEELVESRGRYGVELYGPAQENRQWGGRQAGGYGQEQFAIDWDAEQATCPQGTRSSSWKPEARERGGEVIHIQFAQADCRPCPARAQCTRSTAGRRTINVKPRAQYEALQAARARQTGEEFKQGYRVRAGVEGTISQGVRASGMRETRYIGEAKTRLQHQLTGCALNVIRIDAWLDGGRPGKTRRSAFVRAMPSQVA